MLVPTKARLWSFHAKLARIAIAILLLGVIVPVVQARPQTPISSELRTTAKQLARQGQVKAQMQDYRGAIADFTRAIQLDPDEADFYYQRGLILSQLSDSLSALQDFDDAILRNPNHARAYLHRAGISLNLGSSYRITDYRGFEYQFRTPQRGSGKAMLDLQTARDLFVRQGDTRGAEIANKLIQRFGSSLGSETNKQYQ